MEKELAIGIFKKIIENKELGYHRDYDSTVKYAEKCKTLITGDGMDKMLKKFVKRESDADFKNRVLHTQHVTESYSKALIDPERKVLRSSGVQNIMAHSNQSVIDEFKTISNIFYDGKDVQNYIDTLLVNYMDIDPNAFLVLAWENFDNEKEKAKPYPYIVTSEKAIDYEYKNGELKYLVENQSTDKVYKLVLHSENYTYSIEKVYDDTVFLDGFEKLRIHENDYIILVYEHGQKSVLAKRIGFVPNMRTNGRTCLTFIDASFPWLIKTVKVNSELDLTSNLIAFPKEMMYGPKCTAEDCLRGKTPDGKDCPACGGSGIWRPPTSAQDATVIPIPNNMVDLVPLTSLYYSHAPDVAIITWQAEYMSKLFDNAMRSVYSGDSFTRKDLTQVATTATINLQAIYDSLHPFALHVASMWKWIHESIAEITQIEGIVFNKIFPKDFGFESVEDRINQIKKARDSGVDSHVLESMEDSLARVTYIDNPEDYRRYLVKKHHFPLSGLSDEMKHDAIASGMISKNDIILVYNYGKIFDLIDADIALGINTDFWESSYTKQKKIIDKKVKTIQNIIETGKPESPELVIETGNEDPATIEAQNNLRGTVGGVTGLIEVIKNVAAGVISEEAGVEIITQIYGFDSDSALKMVQKKATIEDLKTANEAGV